MPAPKIEILEEDEYGRTLFSFEVSNKFYPSGACAIVICQKERWNRAYYYEDECFIINATLKDIDVNAVGALKNRNDWNLPLNKDKMKPRLFAHDLFKYIDEYGEDYNIQPLNITKSNVNQSQDNELITLFKAYME